MTAAFLLASLLLAVTPGPGVAYIVSRTLAQGRAAGVASALGVAAGNAANAVGASIGLAAVFAASALAFTGVKLAGAAYLVWLGVRLLRAGESGGPTQETLAPASTRRLFRDGLLVAFLNPKTALFFAAFLPQFMQASAPALPQAVALGAVFVGIAALTDLGYVMLACGAARLFGRGDGDGDGNAYGNGAARWGRRASGAALIGLGLLTAASPSSAGGDLRVAATPC